MNYSDDVASPRFLTDPPLPPQVCGHGRAVTGLDMVSGEGEGEVRVVTAGEDTFARVWRVQDKGETVRRGI